MSSKRAWSSPISNTRLPDEGIPQGVDAERSSATEMTVQATPVMTNSPTTKPMSAGLATFLHCSMREKQAHTPAPCKRSRHQSRVTWGEARATNGLTLDSRRRLISHGFSGPNARAHRIAVPLCGNGHCHLGWRPPECQRISRQYRYRIRQHGRL